MRETLQHTQVEPKALNTIKDFHSTTVNEVKEAITKNKVVIVGMAQNPVVKKARGILTEANIGFKYLEYGSYLKGWKQRLAIKLWSGWPTYPQVFINGKLIGGCSELVEWMKTNTIQ